MKIADAIRLVHIIQEAGLLLYDVIRSRWLPWS